MSPQPVTASLLEEESWQSLLRAVRRGLCVPFLGPEFIAHGVPSRRDLAATWAAESKYPFEECTDLPLMAEYLSVNQDANEPRFRIEDAFRNVSLDESEEARSAYACLADLPVPLYVCTYYDDLMIQALRRSKYPRDPQLKILRWHDGLTDDPGAPVSVYDDEFSFDAGHPVVLHFYGHHRWPDSLVLTAGDYLDFLHFMAADERSLPGRVAQALTRSYLLFLGYRLFEIDFRVLLRVLKELLVRGTYRGSHLSIQFVDVQSEDDRQSAETYLRKYFDKQHIQVVLGDCNDFLTALSQRWKDANP